MPKEKTWKSVVVYQLDKIKKIDKQREKVDKLKQEINKLINEYGLEFAKLTRMEAEYDSWDR